MLINKLFYFVCQFWRYKLTWTVPTFSPWNGMNGSFVPFYGSNWKSLMKSLFDFFNHCVCTQASCTFQCSFYLFQWHIQVSPVGNTVHERSSYSLNLHFSFLISLFLLVGESLISFIAPMLLRSLVVIYRRVNVCCFCLHQDVYWRVSMILVISILVTFFVNVIASERIHTLAEEFQKLEMRKIPNLQNLSRQHENFQKAWIWML